jgi:hypothetical protein
LAGHLAAAAVAGELSPEVAVARHANWLGSGFNHDERALRELYRQLPAPPLWAVRPANRLRARCFAPSGPETVAAQQSCRWPRAIGTSKEAGTDVSRSR